jgi:hypothetical protein
VVGHDVAGCKACEPTRCSCILLNHSARWAMLPVEDANLGERSVMANGGDSVHRPLRTYQNRRTEAAGEPQLFTYDDLSSKGHSEYNAKVTQAEGPNQ